jgi:hypothetical protein
MVLPSMLVTVAAMLVSTPPVWEACLWAAAVLAGATGAAAVAIGCEVRRRRLAAESELRRLSMVRRQSHVRVVDPGWGDVDCDGAA